MLPLRYRRQWIAVNALLIAVVTALTVVPAFLMPRQVTGLPGVDKWLHALTFAILALWFTGQYARRSYWLIAIGLAGYGALIEIGQSLIPYRSAEWGDLVADIVGIAAGLVIALLISGGWSLRAEHWFVDRFGGSIRKQ